MKKTRIIRFIVASIFFASLINNVSVFAAEGGQVETKAGIEFYQDSSLPPTGSTSSSSSMSAEPTDPKGPSGKLPSTGELVKTGATISGVLLLLIGFLFLFRKRKRKEEDE